MKHFFLISVLFISSFSFAQNTQTSFKLCSWNIEWFGSATNGPSNLDLQESNVVKVLKQINADVMGFCEVVDTMRFRRVRDSLGSNYGFAISDYCSGNTTGTGNNWLSGQKLGFIYNKNVVSNVSFRGFMRSSSSAYTNFASGRFPFLMNADVTLNGITKNINFFLIHGKAEGSPCAVSDYNKKYSATREMKDSLDKEYPTALSVIIGDYNDALNFTISSCAGTVVSSYDPLIRDSVNYKSLTLPLAKAGLTSMIDYPNVIDNHVASAALNAYYVSNSVHIASDITATIPNYATNNTTDHYPVFSIYNYSNVATAINNVSVVENNITVYPNPAIDIASVHFEKYLSSATLELFDSNGKRYWTKKFSNIISGQTINIPITNIAKGLSFIKVWEQNKQTVLKIIKQ